MKQNRKFFEVKYQAVKFSKKVNGKVQRGRALKDGKIIVGFCVIWEEEES